MNPKYEPKDPSARGANAPSNENLSPQAQRELLKQEARASGQDLKNEARSIAERSSQRMRAQASDLGQSGREVVQQARQRLDSMTLEARERAAQLADEQRLRAAREVRLACDSLGRASERFREGGQHTFVADYIDTASGGLNNLADYFEQREPMQMLDDARDLARQRPGILLGGMFAVGFAVGRFLTASQRKSRELESRQVSRDFDEQWEVGKPIPVEPRWPHYEQESQEQLRSVRAAPPKPPAPVRRDSPEPSGTLGESSSIRREEKSGPSTEVRR